MMDHPTGKSAPSALREVTIYVLIDPRTERVRYVGKTLHPKTRLVQHCADLKIAEKSGILDTTQIWLQELRSCNMRPTLVPLLVVPESLGRSIEREFIDIFRRAGTALTNVHGVPDNSWMARKRRRASQVMRS